jgi:hypothetical protein
MSLPSKVKHVCGTCHYWDVTKWEQRDTFGECTYPIPRWLQVVAGLARITDHDLNGRGECSTWVQKETSNATTQS